MSRMYAFDRHEVGLPGIPKKGVWPAGARRSHEGERGRLAWLHRDAVKDHLPRCGHEIHDQIALTDRAAA